MHTFDNTNLNNRTESTLGHKKGTNKEYTIIRQKLDYYAKIKKANAITVNSPKNQQRLNYSIKQSDQSDLSLINSKCNTRIIKFAKLTKTHTSEIIKALNKIGLKVKKVSSNVDNRILSSLITTKRINPINTNKSTISFENITFYDSYFQIQTNDLSTLAIYDELSLEILNLLHKYWVNTKQYFDIYYVSNQIIAIDPIPDINQYICQLDTIITKGNSDDMISHSEENGFPSLLAIQERMPHDIVEKSITCKSPYIDYLASKQQNDVIYRCIENNNSSYEECFIFSTPITDKQIAIIFENINFGRSTEVFIADSLNSKLCIEKIFNWFTSHNRQKRNKIRYKQINNNFLETIEYYSIPHININQWMHHINKILGNDVIEKSIFKFVSGLRCPKDVTNRGMISERHEIKSIHNKLIHALYNMLNKQYPNQVGCEIQVTGQHRVDIVVRENDDTYMFYEIKSYNDVHKCIKEGIGQLMNYKFLVRNCCSISQLVIVGYADTTNEVEEYINMYRSEELPISYLQIQI